MPGRRAILPSAMFTLVLIAALSSQAARTTHAADDCLAKPNAPTPQGQHWYYRIDHANNNRQCWRLAPEGLPVQKTAPQAEDETASEPDTQQQSRAPQAASAAPAPAPTHPALPAATAAPVFWPDPSRLPALLPVMPQVQGEPQTASADDTAPVVASDDAPAATSDPPTGSVRAERSSRQPPAAAPQQFAGIDHIFVLLMVMFALLAVTGPILHFTHRQRQREVIQYKPPRWAPVVALNTPATRLRATPPPGPAIVAYRPARRSAPRTHQTDWRPAPDLIPAPAPQPAPVPVHAPDPNERLRHALQQLVDRIQTIQKPEPHFTQRPVQRADIDLLKNAR